jgi:SAM-dependent methyltransferase
VSSRLYGAELLLRRLLPEPLKVVWRLARLALQPVPPGAPAIPQAQLDGAVLLSDRHEMLRRLPKGGRVCELGTLRGDFVRVILDVVAPEELHLVDVHFGLCRTDVLADARVSPHEMLTTEFLGQRYAGTFDWIYVDADHGYEAVVRDIAAAKASVRPGGLLVFNDFGRIVRPGFGVFGVHQAVCEFLAAEGWAVAYFCFNGEALYDIALRRPEATG